MKSEDVIRPERFFRLFASVSNLSGVGPKALIAFKNLGVMRIRDLLFLLPIGGTERVKHVDLKSAFFPKVITLEVLVESYSQINKRTPVRVTVSNCKSKLNLVFFHARKDWIKSILPLNSRRIVSGKIEEFS